MAGRVRITIRPYTPRGYASMTPGDPRNLPFDAKEFINACILARHGPFVDENEDWLRVVRMYNRMITLRIDMAKFNEKCNMELLSGTGILNELFDVDQAPIGPHLYGLPFSVYDFLTICDECEKYYAGDNKAAVPKYKGSRNLFSWMVTDLAIGRINLQDFLGDQIPPHLEKSTILMRVLASAQGPHTQNFRIDYIQFIQSISPPDGPLVGRLSHFQAAAFVQQLETVQVPTEAVEFVSVPHDLCEAGVPADEVVLFHNPCLCDNYISRCCLMMHLIKQGPKCYICRTDRVEWIKSRSRKK
jgi:hypothetical protein